MSARRPVPRRVARQRGVFLIEALIALLIFSLGILGMIAMGGSAMSAQTDARFRTDAAALADDLASRIMLDIDRTSLASIATSLQAFEHRPTTGSLPCSFSGANSVDALVVDWLTKVVTVGPGLPGLPGATADMQQVDVDTTAAGFNRVQITVCWQAPTDKAPRRHVLVTYVNPETL
jgi:type IV pilus assembly protein PilV